MKLFLTKKPFILHLHLSAELPLNTSSIRQGWTRTCGGLADTPCKARLLGVQAMLDCPVCPQIPHSVQSLSCDGIHPSRRGVCSSWPLPFTAPVTLCRPLSPPLHGSYQVKLCLHGTLWVSSQSNSSKLEICYDLICLESDYINSLLRLSFTHIPCGEKDGPGQFVPLRQPQQSTFGSSENKIWPVLISVMLTFIWKGKSSWNNPDPVLPFKFHLLLVALQCMGISRVTRTDQPAEWGRGIICTIFPHQEVIIHV